MNWNNVYNLVMELKKAYGEKYTPILEKQGDKTCLEYWAEVLKQDGCSKYAEMLEPLNIKQHGSYVLLHYANYSDMKKASNKNNNFFFDLYDSLYRECRGVVIDLEREELVLTPFRKFLNVDECEETNIAHVREMIQTAISTGCMIEFSNKLDGSMQCARYYHGEYIMSGSNSLNPELSSQLKDGYRMMKSDKNICQMLKDNPNKTFIFEYISMDDAHVVKYTKEEEGLYLIGIRDVETGAESFYYEVIETANAYGVKTTVLYDKNFETIVSELDDKNSDEAEGFVININGYKVKLKYNDYVKMHRVLNMISAPNLIIEMIADNKFDDFYAKVPIQYKTRVLEIVDNVTDYLTAKTELGDRYYQKLLEKTYSCRKDFMLEMQQQVPKEYYSYIIQRYEGKEFSFLKSVGGRYLKYKDVLEFLQ